MPICHLAVLDVLLSLCSLHLLSRFLAAAQRALMASESAKQWLAWARDKPTAAHWHSVRRAAILKAHPEITTLIGMSDTHDGNQDSHGSGQTNSESSCVCECIGKCHVERDAWGERKRADKRRERETTNRQIVVEGREGERMRARERHQRKTMTDVQRVS